MSLSHAEAATSKTTLGNEIMPLKQFKSGIKAENIICKEGLTLIFKSTNGFPACVKSSSVSKLLMRGWGYDISATSQPIPIELHN
jgi:hypothetical protein